MARILCPVKALAQAVRRTRWAVAGRVGRALAGGRMDAIEAAAARTRAGVHQLARDVHGRFEVLERAVRALEGSQARLEAHQEAELARLAAGLERCAADLRAHQGTLERLDAGLEQLDAGVARVDARVDARGEEIATLREVASRHSQSIRWFAGRHGSAALPAATTGVLVSVVMPTWRDVRTVGAAIESVLAQTYQRWELLVVDDGSDDGTAEVVRRYTTDSRVRSIALGAHAGTSVARNRGLAESRGEIVAYLDADNAFEPGYLAAVHAALAARPDRDCVYLAQLVFDRGRDSVWVRGEDFDAERLREGNFIDLNVFAHRRSLFERYGGFDRRLRRLEDWDLILRYTVHAPPLAVQAIGGRYELGVPDRISTRESYFLSAFLVQRKLIEPLRERLRVLYALWHSPQLSEAYVRAEIDGVRRLGVEVEVWAEEDGVAPFASDVTVHRGPLAEVLGRTAPDLVHVHWLTQVGACRDPAVAAGVPLTVRGHGFDFEPARVAALERDPAVAAVFLFPHLAAACAGHAKVRAMPACFDAERYRPDGAKDPRLVVRASGALPTKDLEAFVRIATRCPGHRFVLILSVVARHEGVVEQVAAYNRSLGSPVDLRVNLDHDAVAALVRSAGIYLHTHGLREPYGMPISIAEAMAVGCWIVGRRCSAAESYVGSAGRLYDTEDEAVALVRETEGWDTARWRAASLAAIDRAYAHFADARVLRPLVDEWRRLAAARTTRAA